MLILLSLCLSAGAVVTFKNVTLHNITASPSLSVIINPANRIDWIPGVTVGVRGGIDQYLPGGANQRTNLINVTLSPYFADNTGEDDASAAIQDAIDEATAHSVVYMPTGMYRLSSTLTIDRNNITLRGDGTNTVLLGFAPSVAFKVGRSQISSDPYRGFTVVNSPLKGQTNLVLSAATNLYGQALSTNKLLSISTQTRNTGTDEMPIISVANYDRIIRQTVAVESIFNGTNIVIWPPLVWDYTNAPLLAEFVDNGSDVRYGIGLENFSLTETNNGEAGSAGFMLLGTCLRDCWFEKLDLGFGQNYNFQLVNSINCQIRQSRIHDRLSEGTSHAGLLLIGVAGLLVEDTIFANSSDTQFDDIMGCAFFGNYFTNNAIDVICHNSHPMMNLFEANVFNSFFQMDGYFGSASHQTLFRNRIINTLPLKRWTSNMQIVGNVCVSTNYSYVWYKEESGYGSPYPVFEMGYPNIGNSAFVGVSPPIAWNFPGNSLSGFFGEPLTNGVFTFTGDYGPTNTLWTNMGTGTFTNIPAPIGVGYALVFQDDANTNLYYGATNSDALYTTGAGTASNVVLSSYVFVTNGSRLFIAGQNSYQQLQSSDKDTHTFHGNLVYTNASGTVVWATGITHDIPNSLIYTNDAPSWWGTNRWPAIDPVAATPTTPIPAQSRYAP